MKDISQFIKQAPKTDLHVHLEGTIEPELLIKLADKNKINLPYKSVGEINSAYNFKNLDHFLKIFNLGSKVLRTSEDFYEITVAYLENALAQNTIHSEIFIDPQSHKRKGIQMEIMLEGVLAATNEFYEKHQISTSLILCFLRNHSQKEAIEILHSSKGLHHHFEAVGLAAAELNNPPSKFVDLYKMAKSYGFKLTAHAGEEGPSSYVRGSIDELNVDRIDHGNSSIDDRELLELLVDKQIPLTMCPLSNLKLQVIKNLKDHPMKRMLDMGINVTINSDDPSYFDGYLTENLLAMQSTFSLSYEEIIKIMKNGINAAYVKEERRAVMMKQLNDFIVQFDNY